MWKVVWEEWPLWSRKSGPREALWITLTGAFWRGGPRALWEALSLWPAGSVVLGSTGRVLQAEEAGGSLKPGSGAGLGREAVGTESPKHLPLTPLGDTATSQRLLVLTRFAALPWRI